MVADIRTTLGSSPFDGRAFRWRMGVRTLDPSEWLQIDEDREIDLLEKESVLGSCYDEVVAFDAADGVAESEVFDLTMKALEARGLLPRSKLHHHPVVEAARNIQEDVCILERRREEWVLTAGVVCFPTRWSLADKIGLPIREIHQPVPGIESISPTIDRFFDRMNRGSLVVRTNWSLTDDPSLRLEPQPNRGPVTFPDDPSSEIWLRVERQTIRKLRASGAICFTIRVHRWALGDAIKQLSARTMASSLAAIPIDVAEYKDIEGMRKGLIKWLTRL